MVKIRLSRIGTKGRPFYRVVVTESSTPRGGKVVETLGTYDPTVKPTRIEIDEEKALAWLLKGAQPTETTAILLNRSGVLPRFLEQRPAQKKNYSFLDKRTAAISVASSVEAPANEEA
ncbi:MAG TPA: 30S ribosomal protein S16 [Fimbriimonas sp.]